MPDAEAKKTTDGRLLNFSKNPNDRAIAGASSGGICAFTAAWERPDAFRRVFSAFGSFVAMRGGNEYPALIRKTDLNLFVSFWKTEQKMHGILFRALV